MIWYILLVFYEAWRLFAHFSLLWKRSNKIQFAFRINLGVSAVHLGTSHWILRRSLSLFAVSPKRSGICRWGSTLRASFDRCVRKDRIVWARFNLTAFLLLIWGKSIGTSTFCSSVIELVNYTYSLLRATGSTWRVLKGISEEESRKDWVVSHCFKNNFALSAFFKSYFYFQSPSNESSLFHTVWWM